MAIKEPREPLVAGDCKLRDDLAFAIDPARVADVRDADAIDRALAGVDTVLHLAAKVGLGVDVGDLPDYASSNDVGTAELLAAMARGEGPQNAFIALGYTGWEPGQLEQEEFGRSRRDPVDLSDVVGGEALGVGLVADQDAMAKHVAREHLHVKNLRMPLIPANELAAAVKFEAAAKSRGNKKAPVVLGMVPSVPRCGVTAE